MTDLPNPSPGNLRLPDNDRWFCLRARTKTEHIAAVQLRHLSGVEPFCPRLRFQRMTKRGRVWFPEAMFPGYFFARFNPARLMRIVRHAQGVTGLVEFGGRPVMIPSAQIEALRELVGPTELCEVKEGLRVGDEVEVVAGPLRGLEVVVTTILPTKDRVRILLEFLGNLREVEINREALANPKRFPKHLQR